MLASLIGTAMVVSRSPNSDGLSTAYTARFSYKHISATPEGERSSWG